MKAKRDLRYCKTWDFGMILFLKISYYEEDWEMERSGLKNGYADVYCYNLDEEDGEYGSIGFEVANGGLIITE